MLQSESMKNLVTAPRIEPQKNDSSKASKLSGTVRSSKPQKLSKSKKQTRSITPRETYADVMKEIAIAKAAINRMLPYDDRKREAVVPVIDFESDEKVSKRNKKKIR